MVARDRWGERGSIARTALAALLFVWASWLGLGVDMARAEVGSRIAIAAAPALGAAPAPSPAPEDPNEVLFGATRIAGATGSGRVSVGVSDRGEVTVLRWPSPSMFNQIAYRTSRGKDARARPLFGASPNEGLLLGLSYVTGGRRVFRWLRGDGFTHALLYEADDSAILIDRVTDEAAGIELVVDYICPPGRDVLCMGVSATLAPGSPVSGVRLLVFEHFAPTHIRLPYLPLYDTWVQDPDVLRYDAALRALVHRRALRRWLPFRSLPERPPPETFLAAADRDAAQDVAERGEGPGGERAAVDPEGPVICLGADRVPSGVQCGPASRLLHHAADAYFDAQQGPLHGSVYHDGRSDGALSFDLSLAPGGHDAVAIDVALGHTLDDATRALAGAREAGIEGLRASTRDHWRDRLAHARLPDDLDVRERSVLRRALITLLQARDPESGAIVASISTQPPYAEDWPRDGAFLDLVLDLAGFSDEVTAHKRFYAHVQRRVDRFMGIPHLAQPAGTFEMNYYADGAPGGPWVFEIDNTGCAVWGFYQHYLFLRASGAGAAAKSYLAQIYPSIRLATDALARWRDPRTGLQAPASEDDHPQQTQLLQGAETVALALRSGIAAGREAGEDPRVLDRWDARETELTTAIAAHLYSPGRGFSLAQGWDPIGWLVWPCAVFDPADARVRAEIEPMWDELDRRLSGVLGHGSYDPKLLIALMVLVGKDPQWQQRLEASYRIFIDRMPTPGTLLFGETYATTSSSGGIRYEQRTAIPHSWAAALCFLAAVLHHTGSIDPK